MPLEKAKSVQRLIRGSHLSSGGVSCSKARAPPNLRFTNRPLFLWATWLHKVCPYVCSSADSLSGLPGPNGSFACIPLVGGGRPETALFCNSTKPPRQCPVSHLPQTGRFRRGTSWGTKAGNGSRGAQIAEQCSHEASRHSLIKTNRPSKLLFLEACYELHLLLEFLASAAGRLEVFVEFFCLLFFNTSDFATCNQVSSLFERFLS